METLHREKVAVMGSGSWGTALAVLLAENGHDVALWS
ncbi:MAG: 2-dehydropantoate 2-reductase N-terminal domain-containing protein, partial [Clostridia bacterium]